MTLGTDGIVRTRVGKDILLSRAASIHDSGINGTFQLFR